jgi:hypothetical protein
MVSPPESGSDVLIDVSRTRASSSGNAVAFASLSGFGDIEGMGASGDYMATRTAKPGTNGWETHGLTPTQEPSSRRTPGRWPYYVGEFSSDLSAGVFSAYSPVTNEDPAVQAIGNLYVRRDLERSGHGTYQLVTGCPACSGGIPPVGAKSPFYRPIFDGASSDFTHVVFQSPLNLTPDAPAQSAFCIITGLACQSRVYESVNGVVRLASILPDGSPAQEAFPEQDASIRYTPRVISSDGTRVFFMVPSGLTGGSGDLYMRVNGATTVKLNASERTVPDAPQEARFETATPDGKKIFFTTQENLTDDDSGTAADLYMYDVDAPAGHHLTRVSADNEPGDGANEQGVLGISDDGEYVYFLDRGQLVAHEPLLNGQDGIYVWHAGSLRYIGNLPSLADESFDVEVGAFVGAATFPARVSPDGRHALLVAQNGAGLTGYDHGTTCPDDGDAGCTELYLYNYGDSRPVCVSCRPGFVGQSNATVVSKFGVGVAGPTTHLNHPMTDDGSEVFFDTGDSLVPEDTNGMRDVYEYSADGVHLLSTGKSTSDSYFMDATPNGSDVFFVTRQALVGWDDNDNYDLYDARVGGGLPEPATAPECSGDACQGALSEPPDTISVGSSLLASGTGNVQSVVRKVVMRSLTRAQKLNRALRKCKSKRKKVQRKKCESSARKSFERGK